MSSEIEKLDLAELNGKVNDLGMMIQGSLGNLSNSMTSMNIRLNVIECLLCEDEFGDLREKHLGSREAIPFAVLDNIARQFVIPKIEEAMAAGKAKAEAESNASPILDPKTGTPVAGPRLVTSDGRDIVLEDEENITESPEFISTDSE